MALFLSIDQSTSVTKGLVWDSEGRLLARADVPHRQLTNDLGWVGHDPMEILRNTLRAAALAVEKAEVRPEEIRAVGISNQRETAVCWDASTGEPVCEAVVWQCGRASEQCARLEAQGLADSVKAKTGLPLSPYFSAAKFAWMLENEPKAQQALARGTLRCGTVDAWLLWNLTGTFATEYSNASRTQLLNLDTLDWDAELAAAFGLTAECLPQIRMSDSFFGETTMGGLFPKPVPVHGVLGDSHAALYGNRCMRPGEAKVTYGTGSSLMLNAGPQRPKAREGVVTSLAWGVQHEVDYVLEGNVNYIGAVIQWLPQDVELLEQASDAGRIAAEVPSTNGVYLVPAFSGLGAPYFNDKVRAAFVGMNRSTKRAHLVRAAEECIAYQIADVAAALQAGEGPALRDLCADGGPTRDAFLMQLQADLLGLPIRISATEELSGAGAAFCAARGAGLAEEDEWFSHAAYREILPYMPREKAEEMMAGWRRAVELLAGGTL